MTSPRGITAARPPFFILRVGARPLGFIDFGDLKRLRCFLEPCFEFFIFPKTAAGPGASEKPGARLERLLAPLGRVLSPLDRLSGSLEAPLGASWGGFGSLLGPLGALLEASWGLLGASWDKDNMPKTSQLPDPQMSSPPPLWGAIWEAKNRPKSHPKRVQI